MLFDDKPGNALRPDTDRDFDIVFAVKFILSGPTLLLSDSCRSGQPGIVQRQFQFLINPAIKRVVNHCQTLSLELRIDVQDTIDIAPIGSSHVDDIRVEDVAIAFVKVHPLFDEGFCLLGIVQPWSAVAGLDT